MFYLAIRHLLARKKQTFIIVFGIFIGTTGYVLISGFIEGVQMWMKQTVIENDAHIKISASEKTINREEIEYSLYDENESVFWLKEPGGKRGFQEIRHPQGWFDRLNEDPEVFSYTPTLSVQIILTRGDITRSATIHGVNPYKFIRMTGVGQSMTKGDFLDIGHSGNRIVLGDELLMDLGASVNDTVFVTTGKNRPEPFRIVGTYHIGMPHLDSFSVFGAIADVQKVNQTPSLITGISVNLVDADLATEIAGRWSMLAVEEVKSWEESNEQFLSAFQVQNTMRYMVSIAILAVAGFGIYNVLSIIVTQKKKEIAILRSVGYDAGDIKELFLIQGVILGVAGGLFGLLAGFLLCLYFSQVQIYPENIALDGRLPFSFSISIYIIGFLMASVSSLIASYLPARAAGKMTPIDIIRSEMQ